MTGVFQGLEARTAAFGEMSVLDRLVVFGTAAATAANILGHELFFGIGVRILPHQGCIPYGLGTSPL
jgi:hypothetical protein